jgi:hypothetical protein
MLRTLEPEVRISTPGDAHPEGYCHLRVFHGDGLRLEGSQATKRYMGSIYFLRSYSLLGSVWSGWW